MDDGSVRLDRGTVRSRVPQPEDECKRLPESFAERIAFQLPASQLRLEVDES